MSIAGQRPRLPDDSYYTPGWCVRALFGTVPELTSVYSVYDPCAGDGAILKAVPPHLMKYANEIRTEEVEGLSVLCGGESHVFNYDAAQIEYDSWTVSDLILTNPPFSLADELVPRFYGQSKGPVSVLLRANWLYAGKRNGYRRPDYVVGLPIRPVFADFCLGLSKTKTRDKVRSCGASFKKGEWTLGTCPNCKVGRVGAQTDATDYAWHVWLGEKHQETSSAKRTALVLADRAFCAALKEGENG